MKDTTDNKALISLIQRTVGQPLDFENLVTHWNKQFSDIRHIPTDNQDASDLEHAARNALSALTVLDNRNTNSSELSRIVNTFPHATLLVRSNGKISACNLAANRRLLVDEGQNISEIGYTLSGAKPIVDAVASTVSSDQTEGKIALLHAYSDETGHAVTIAIASAKNLGNSGQLAMVFVIDPVWHQSAQALIQKAYGLTGAESEVLVAFVNGQTILEIAKQRGRSKATVRVQFQSILSKAGARNQSDLLRSTLALSQFVGEIGDVSYVAQHPYRRTAQILRPDNRMVEVTLAGDMTGSPIIFLPSVSQYTFPEFVEAMFKRAGLLLISICRPDWAGTDTPPEGQDQIECLAADIEAVQDQLGIKTCPVLVHSTSTPFGYMVATHISDRINRIVVLSGFPPPQYMNAGKTTSPWTSALLRVGNSSPAVVDFMLQTGMKAWRLMGSKRFLAMQHKGSDVDIALFSQPDCIAEFDKAMMAATANGPDACKNDLIVGRQDWSEFVRTCSIPSHILHGTLDPQSNIVAMRAFASDFSDRVKLSEIEGCGFMSMLSHTKEVISLLVAIDR